MHQAWRARQAQTLSSTSSSDSEDDVPLAHYLSQFKKQQQEEAAVVEPDPTAQEPAGSKLTGEALAKAVLAAQNRYALLSLGSSVRICLGADGYLNVDDAEVRKAYMKIGAKIHPDKLPGFADSTKAFQALVRAYERCCKPELREDESDDSGEEEEEEKEEQADSDSDDDVPLVQPGSKATPTAAPKKKARTTTTKKAKDPQKEPAPRKKAQKKPRTNAEPDKKKKAKQADDSASDDEASGSDDTGFDDDSDESDYEDIFAADARKAKVQDERAERAKRNTAFGDADAFTLQLGEFIVSDDCPICNAVISSGHKSHLMRCLKKKDSKKQQKKKKSAKTSNAKPRKRKRAKAQTLSDDDEDWSDDDASKPVKAKPLKSKVQSTKPNQKPQLSKKVAEFTRLKLKCKNCHKPAAFENYGYCALHRTPSAQSVLTHIVAGSGVSKAATEFALLKKKCKSENCEKPAAFENYGYCISHRTPGKSGKKSAAAPSKQSKKPTSKKLNPIQEAAMQQKKKRKKKSKKFTYVSDSEGSDAWEGYSILE